MKGIQRQILYTEHLPAAGTFQAYYDAESYLKDMGYITGSMERQAPIGFAPSPTGPHSFSNPQGGVVVAYHRDRGELGTGAANHASVDEFFHGDIEEYGYLLTKEDKWVFATYNNRNPQTLIE
jgi:hypothetical protein